MDHWNWSKKIMTVPVRFRVIVICMLLFIFLELVAGIRRYNSYKTYYIEDNCSTYLSSRYEIDLKSAVQVKATRKSRPTPNLLCSMHLVPQSYYRLILNIQSFNFGIGSNEIFTLSPRLQIRDSSTLVADLHGTLVQPKSYFEVGMASLAYFTILGNVTDGQGFTIIVTAYVPSCTPSKDLFRCDNGYCIWSDFQCDSVNNCGDNSDENPYGNSNCDVVSPKTKNIDENRTTKMTTTTTKIIIPTRTRQLTTPFPYVSPLESSNNKTVLVLCIVIPAPFIIAIICCCIQSIQSSTLENRQTRRTNRFARNFGPLEIPVFPSLRAETENTPPPTYTSTVKEVPRNGIFPDSEPPPYSLAIAVDSNGAKSAKSNKPPNSFNATVARSAPSNVMLMDLISENRPAQPTAPEL